MRVETVRVQVERKPAAPRRNVVAVKELCARAAELYILGNFTEAAATYKRALAAERDHAPAHRGLGFVYQRMGFGALALTSLRRYLELAPSAADAAAIEKRIDRLGGSR